MGEARFVDPQREQERQEAVRQFLNLIRTDPEIQRLTPEQRIPVIASFAEVVQIPQARSREFATEVEDILFGRPARAQELAQERQQPSFIEGAALTPPGMGGSIQPLLDVARIQGAETPQELTELIQRTITPSVRGGGALAIPTALSQAGLAAGTAIAPALGPGAPAAPLVGEALGDTAGYLTNVAIGLEDFSLPQLGLAIGTPFAARGLAAGATRLAKRTNVFKVAENNLVRRANEEIESRWRQIINLARERGEVLSRGRTKKQVDSLISNMKAARVEYKRRARNLIKIRQLDAVDDAAKFAQNNLPVVDQGTITALYREASDLMVDPSTKKPLLFPTKIIDDARKELRQTRELITQDPVIVGLGDTKVNQLLQDPTQVAPEVSPILDMLGKPIVHDAQKEGMNTIQRLRAAQVELNFVAEGLKKSTDAAAPSRLSVVNKLRDAIEQTFDDIAQSQGGEVTLALRKANAAYKTNRTFERLNEFYQKVLTPARFDQTIETTKRGLQGETDLIFNPRKAAKMLESKEFEPLRRRLDQMGILQEFKTFLKGIEVDQAATTKQFLAREQRQTGRIKEFQRKSQALETPERTAEFLPQPLPNVPEPDVLGSAVRAAVPGLGAGFGAGAAGLAFGADPQVAASIGLAVASPSLALALLSTNKAGRKMMKILLNRSNGLIGQNDIALLSLISRAGISFQSTESERRGQPPVEQIPTQEPIPEVR